MGYFNTKYQKDSAKITTLIVLILLLLIFVIGPQYMDPPEEYGVAVNFGNSNVGSGNIQPNKPVKSEPQKVNKEPQVETSKSEPTKSSETKEDVLTQETEEAIAIKKQKEAEEKAKAETERIEKAKAEAEERKRKDEEDKTKKLDAIMNPVINSKGTATATRGEGNDSQPGNKGIPYAPYKGTPEAGTGGIGYGLNDRGKPQYKFYQDCADEKENGKVVVDIVVNQNGNVVEAIPGVKGTESKTQCLMDLAKKIALSFKFPPDSKAPTRQYGRVILNFTPN